MSKKTKLSSKNAATERLGETRTMNCGEVASIVEYTNYNDITVQFKNTEEVVKTTYRYFKNGQVKSRFAPSVYGIGYLGYEKVVDENGNKIKSYIEWFNMLRRCFDEKWKEKHPSYKDVTCCNEWLCFQNFAKWFDNNYYEIEGERMDLDKDILVKGNKMYSPETCVFVPQNINTLFIKSNKTRGKYPIGVCKASNSNKFIAKCMVFINGKTQRKYLGLYNTPEDAFNVYKEFKEKYIKQVADYYKDKIPNRLYEAMHNYKVEITD